MPVKCGEIIFQPVGFLVQELGGRSDLKPGIVQPREPLGRHPEIQPGIREAACTSASNRFLPGMPCSITIRFFSSLPSWRGTRNGPSAEAVPADLFDDLHGPRSGPPGADVSVRPDHVLFRRVLPPRVPRPPRSPGCSRCRTAASPRKTGGTVLPGSPLPVPVSSKRDDRKSWDRAPYS